MREKIRFFRKKRKSQISLDFEQTKWYSYTSSTQTRKTWARHIEAYDDIPEEFRSAFPEHDEYFPYILLIPEDKYSISHKRNRMLFCVYEDRFLLLELVDDDVKTVSALFSDVISLERGLVLLHSWISIRMLHGSLSIRFNTANEYLFAPIIEKFRKGMSPSLSSNVPPTKNKQDTLKFYYLNKLSYKFMNLGIESIRPNDLVIAVSYQPERSLKEFSLFNKTLFKRSTTAHLSVLTEKELILIKEPKPIKTNKASIYGGIFIYIPRHRIDDISFIHNSEKSLYTMGITLPDNTHLETEFSSTNKDLNLFQRALKQETP